MVERLVLKENDSAVNCIANLDFLMACILLGKTISFTCCATNAPLRDEQVSPHLTFNQNVNFIDPSSAAQMLNIALFERSENRKQDNV